MLDGSLELKMEFDEQRNQQNNEPESGWSFADGAKDAEWFDENERLKNRVNSMEKLNIEKGSKADKLVSLTLESGVELYLDQFDTPCISLPDRPLVGFPIESLVLKRWLSGKFWEISKQGISRDDFQKVVSCLEGKAYHESNNQILYNRIARKEGIIYYDLGNDHRVVRVSTDGWVVTADCPVKFRRFIHQLTQVEPDSNNPNLFKVIDYINLESGGDKFLFITYLVTSFIPDIPHPLIALVGDHGSAKSSDLRVLRSLIDPSKSELLDLPYDAKELAQLANHNYCLYLDNLSELTTNQSNNLSRLVTGIGFSKRKLYTDDEDIIFNQKVLVGTTGINPVAQMADLLDRSLIFNLDRIPENKRRDEEEFWNDFNYHKAILLGGLFNILSKVLKTVPNISTSRKPRMADFGKYGAALAVVFGKPADYFINVFDINIKRQNQAAIESSPTAQVILQFMNDKNQWSGSSSDLYTILKELVVASNLHIGSDGFPKSSNWLWRKIKVIRPNLLDLGTQVNHDENESNSVITLINLRKKDTNTASAAIQPKENSGNMATMATEEPTSNEKKETDDLAK